jgi:hypothetical protein
MSPHLSGSSSIFLDSIHICDWYVSIGTAVELCTFICGSLPCLREEILKMDTSTRCNVRSERWAFLQHSSVSFNTVWASCCMFPQSHSRQSHTPPQTLVMTATIIGMFTSRQSIRAIEPKDSCYWGQYTNGASHVQFSKSTSWDKWRSTWRVERATEFWRYCRWHPVTCLYAV